MNKINLLRIAGLVAGVAGGVVAILNGDTVNGVALIGASFASAGVFKQTDPAPFQYNR